MAILRVFPRRTSHTPVDPLAFVGEPGGDLPEAEAVHVSCCFTWDVQESFRLAKLWGRHYRRVLVGGPAVAPENKGFVPGMYLREGITFTSKGCPHKCSFCLVPLREGPLRLLDPIPEGYIIQDNNFAATPKEHRGRTYRMLDRQPKAAIFSGGIDARLVTDDLASEFRDLRINSIFLAADSLASLRPLERAVGRLSYLGRNKLRCYMLLAYRGETVDQALYRLEKAWEIGVLPFAQLYRPPGHPVEYSKEWKQLARVWSRPAAMVSMHKVRAQGE